MWPSKATVDADLQPAGVQGTACLPAEVLGSLLPFPPSLPWVRTPCKSTAKLQRQTPGQTETNYQKPKKNRHTGSTETEGFSISHSLRVTLITHPRWMPPEWCGGMAPRDSQKGFTKVAARRPHQRKMNRQHRGKRLREREKYTQDFLQLPTPLHPGTVFKKRELNRKREGDLCPGPTGLTSHPSVPLRLHFQSATPLQVDQQRPGWGCRA